MLSPVHPGFLCGLRAFLSAFLSAVALAKVEALAAADA
jgi:hypothetical protein